MFTKLAIWYLRKKKLSVLINFKCTDGTIQQLSTKSRIYDNQFNNVEYLGYDGKPFSIPIGKFKVKVQ